MAMTKEEKRERARWSRIFRVYGITPEQYRALDDGRCPVCERPWSDTVRPCIDHDHVTGEVRGLLCVFCNRYVVGRHRDASILRRASDYLDRPRRGWIVPPKTRKRKKKQ